MIFSKRPTGQTTIPEFWRWWADARTRVEKFIASGDWDPKFITEIGKRVNAIDPGLRWEFGKGTTSTHVLVVSFGGDPALRAVAERWRTAAPPGDATWSYHASRQPSPETFEATMQIAGHTVVLSKLRYGASVDPDRRQVDVVVYHPVFASMSAEQRGQVAFLSLDWALGEQATELWVGAVDAVTEPPEVSRTPAQLRDIVAGVEEKGGADSWALMSGQDSGGAPVIVTFAVPFKPARWPRFDTYVGVRVPYRHRDDGLPADGVLDELTGIADRLGAALGSDGGLVAQETTRGVRTLHFYVDGSSGALAAIRSRTTSPMTLSSTLDPSWTELDHLR